MVEDAQALQDMADTFAKVPIIGIDTESDSFYHYQEKVCLIQFSDLEKDYILDPLAVSDLSPLNDVMANRDIVKIFHGADYDIVCLKRDFGFDIHNIFDSMVSAQLLGLPKLGLADLIGEYFGHTIDKKYQRHNWAARPLKDEHLDYARGDTHWLLAIREILIRKPKKRGRLHHLEEECEILERREWASKGFDEDGYLKIKHSGTLDDTGKRVLKRLYLYRDSVARKIDRPTFKVLPNQLLIDVAAKRPETMGAFDRMFPRKSAMKKKYASHIIEAVKQGLEDDFKIPRSARNPKRAGPPPKLTGRTAERAFNALKTWRNRLCDDDPLMTPVGVASNGTLKAIVAHHPANLEELGEIPDVRQWQVEWFGETMLEVLEKAVAATPKEGEGGGGRRRNRRKR